MAQRLPVADWTTDFDVMDPAYIEDPFSIWDDLRKKCPIAHTNRRGGAWLLTTYADVTEAAHDIERFSSLEVGVIATEEEPDDLLPYGLPPISADPPLHTWTRRLLLPWFSHAKIDSYEAMTRDLCRRLIDSFIATGHADAATLPRSAAGSVAPSEGAPPGPALSAVRRLGRMTAGARDRLPDSGRTLDSGARRMGAHAGRLGRAWRRTTR